ncbi:MAG: TfoX/Sxy family protein [Ginsengibacter sp.]
MAYDTKLADMIRELLADKSGLKIDEKQMFGGLAFMVNNKMCINVSGDNLMCRFNPAMQEQISERPGFQPMIMRGKEMSGYCYINPSGFKSNKDLIYLVNLCLDYNSKARSSKKKK